MAEKMLGSFDQKTNIEDTDLLAGYDTTAAKVKNFKFSNIWNWAKAKLGTAAFCSVINNLTTAAEGGVLDARQGKALSDALSKLNTLVGTTSISGIGGGTITGAINELNSKAEISEITDANTVFLESNDHSFTKRRYYLGRCKNVPNSYSSGMLFTFKDDAGYGWQIVVYNGNVSIRNISNNSFDDWS